MSMMPRAGMLVRGGPEDGSTILLSEGMSMIGRSAFCDIVVDEPGVSRQHAAIRGDANGFWISDLGSRNGTFVNGVKVGQEPHLLQNSDLIELGGMTTQWIFMESSQTIEIPSLEATVTILFTDIEGSTAMTERLGDSRARTVFRTHDAIIRRQTHAHGGTEVNQWGDGFLLTFPSARRGVACAVAAQRELAEHNRKHPDAQIAVRMGLSVGEPVVEEQDLFGKSVIMAARIRDEASGGQVFVSQIVYSLVASTGDFAFREVGDFDLKGISDSEPLYEVLWQE